MGKGNIIGKPNLPTSSVASGVWSLMEQFVAKKNDSWPVGLESISFFANATSTASTITVPANIQEDDIAILFDISTSNTATNPTTVIPSGFTSIIVNTRPAVDNNRKAICSYKLLVGTEGSSSLTGMASAGGTDGTKKILVIFRPNAKLVETVSLSTPSGFCNDQDPPSQIISMSGQTPPLLGIVCYSSTGVVDPRTATEATFSEISNGTNMYLKYCIFNKGDTPTNATVDMQDEGFNNSLQSFWVKLS